MGVRGEGTVVIKANDQTGTVAFTSLAMSGVTPGATQYASLKITNGGTTSFTYQMATATSGDAGLAAALTIGIKVVPTSACAASDYSGSSTVAYAEAAGLAGATIATRPLASGASEFLCFKVALPAGASNALQGLTANATFSFSASA